VNAILKYVKTKNVS